VARRAAAVLATVALGAGVLPAVAVPLAGPASAALRSGVAFTGAALSTWQTNGVVWSVAESAGLVFAGGTFTAVRPPGEPSGSASSLSRTNLVVLDGATGAPTDCAPAITGSTTPTVRALDVSPDGRTLYVGGSFTAVDGVSRQHLAAIDLATCTVVPGFVPKPSGIVRAVDATASAVYYGGGMVSVDGQSRGRAAAAGAVGSAQVGQLLAWAPVLDKEVRAIAVRPGGSEVVVGGDFDTVNGAASNALAVVDPTSGTNLFTYPGFIEPESAVKDLTVDDTGFYTGNEGTGFQKFDGRIALDWSTHGQRWRDTCLGATQAVVVYDGLLYSGSHVHDCTTMGSFPDGLRYHLLAQSVSDPTLLPWFPQTNDGIGEALGPRDMVVSRGPGGHYMWAGGEFTTVNGVAQQGLTRFGQDPARQAAPTVPTASVTSVEAGQVRVAWRQSFDADDELLSYTVLRDGVAVHTSTATSWFWSRQQMTFLDEGLAPGAVHKYTVQVTDGRSTVSSVRSATVAGTDSAYTARVLADGAQALWRYDETSDVFFADTSPVSEGLTLRGAAARGAAGAITGEPSPALTVPGTTTSSTGATSTSTLHTERRVSPPGAFSVETWFKTTTTTGGKLIGFGDKQVLSSRNFDRHVYMTDSGQLVFGVHNGAVRTVTSPAAYNDGAWHHVVATQGSAGMALHVDGVKVAGNTVTSAMRIDGYWRVGGDNISCRVVTCYGVTWPTPPTSDYFAGTLDETAVYRAALSSSTVAAHYALGTGTAVPDSTAPSSPSGVAVSVSGSTPTVSWSASTDDVGVTGYEVHRSTSSGFSVSESSRVGSVSTTSFTDGALADGTYYYRVVALDAAGNRSAASAQVSAVVSTSTQTEPTVVQVAPSADAYVNGAAASTNYGTSSSLATRSGSGYVSYLRFSVPAAPAGAVLTGAELRFRTSTTTGAGSADVQRLSWAGDSWTETGVTWNTRPAVESGVLGQVTASAGSTAYRMPLDVGALQGLPGTTRTVAMTSSGTDSMWWWSRQHSTSSYRPALVLTYGGSSTSSDSTAPSSPSGVAVSVSGSTPTVSWSASTDDVGVTGYEVHRSTSSGFSVSESSRVGSVSTTSFTDGALADGTYYYRVVALDAAGNRSAASAQVSAVVSTSTQTEPTVVQVAPSADAYVNGAAASTNYGTSSSLATRSGSGYVSYLRFSVPAAPAGAVLTGAELRFRTSTTTGAGSADVQRLSWAGDSWTETGVTWNTRPAVESGVLGQVTASAGSTAYRMPLDVGALQGLPGTTRTVAMTSSGTDSMWWWSRQHSTSSYRPALVLTYS
jgi:hypothetical protein